MNATTSTTAVRTYKIVTSLFDYNKYEVQTFTNGQPKDWLRTNKGIVRVFSTRNGARKAISREIRGIRN